MFLMNVNRRVAALAVVAALSLGGPLAAAGWEMPAGRVDSGDFLSGGIFTRFLVWLGVAPAAEVVLKCEGGGSIDPNGCPKARVGKRPHTTTANGATSKGGERIDPRGLH